MACDLAAGRAFPCKDAIGGIKDVCFIEYSDSAFAAASAGAVADTTAVMDGWRYELLKNTGSFVQTISDTMATGGLFYTQVLTIQFPKLTAATNDELQNLLQSRVIVIVRDSNDNTHLMGISDGAEVTAGSLNSGAGKGDVQGYELTFTAEEALPAPFFIDMTNSTARSGLSFAITVAPEYPGA